jgi:hypothetical protein
MTNLAISLPQLLIIGMPQVFLFVLAIYIFTGTKFDIKKYIIFSAVITVLTYLIRFLPISLGVNSMLSFLALVLLFLITYKFDLPKIIRLTVSVIITFMFICISEIINEIILMLAFGKVRTQDLLNSSSELMRSLFMIPTNIIFAIIVFVSYIVLSKKKSKKELNGEVSEKTGE